MSHFAEEAEKAVLGAIIVDPDSLLQASDILGPEDFSTTAHRVIFNALFELYQLGEKIDLITLVDRLKSTGHIKQAGGEEYIADIASELVTSANIKFHSRIVHEKSLLRRTCAWAQAVTEQSKNGIDNIPEWLGQIESDLIEISQAAKSKTSPYTHDILKELGEYWNDSLSGKEICVRPPDFLKPIIPGFYPKHLWIIGGYTGKGKSKFLNQLLVDAMDAGAKIILFSIEDSREEKMMGLISNLADIPYKALITGKITGYEDRIEKAKKMIAKWNPIIYDDVRTVDDIRLKAKKHKIREGIDIIAIDYLQNLAIRNTLYETMADAAGKLYALVKELKITCLAVSQIDNESAKKESNIIGLKGAGELAAAAHIVLWLTRVRGEGRERHLDCSIKKNRAFGETGKIELTFTEKWTGVMQRHL